MKNRHRRKSVPGREKSQKGRAEELWLGDEFDADWPDDQLARVEPNAMRFDTRQLRARRAIETALEELALKAAMEDFPEYRILR